MGKFGLTSVFVTVLSVHRVQSHPDPFCQGFLSFCNASRHGSLSPTLSWYLLHGLDEIKSRLFAALLLFGCVVNYLLWLIHRKKVQSLLNKPVNSGFCFDWQTESFWTQNSLTQLYILEAPVLTCFYRCYTMFLLWCAGCFCSLLFFMIIFFFIMVHLIHTFQRLFMLKELH